jgi:hypothetical protein
MDPYLEDPALWGGVHQGLITYARELLQGPLRARGYYADIGERVIVVTAQDRPIVPDVTIPHRPSPQPESSEAGAPAAATAVAVIEADTPVELEAWTYEERQPFVEVFTREGQLVTVIELLSPSNKRPGAGRNQYLRKQNEVLESAVNLVEIDLLREGLHTVAVPEELVRESPQIGNWSYLVSVNRASRRERFQVYPVSLRSRLPRIRIPLKSEDADAVLDLQAAFERAYESGPYPDRVNYAADPAAPLAPDDAKWAGEQLRGRVVT